MQKKIWWWMWMKCHTSPQEVRSRAGTCVTVRITMSMESNCTRYRLANHLCCYWFFEPQSSRCGFASLPHRHCQSGRTTSPKFRVTSAKHILWVWDILFGDSENARFVVVKCFFIHAARIQRRSVTSAHFNAEWRTQI